MYDIKDYHRYTTLMRNGFYDKLFFIDKIFGQWKTFLDFGCADGFLTKMIAEIFPDKQIIGYDKSPEMIARAIGSGSMPANVTFTTSLPTSGIDIIYFCSVLHEITDEMEREELEDHILDKLTPKYMIIRDMCFSFKNSIYTTGKEKLISNISEYLSFINKKGELERFENIYGSIKTDRSFAQFLLKYSYIESPNWDRELNEDYFNSGSLIHRTSFRSGSRLTYIHDYNIPYLEQKWEDDFRFIAPSTFFTTHTQRIYKYEY